ncbi:hypothetical protein ACIQXA_39915, partial [Streptomyces massasporeus]
TPATPPCPTLAQAARDHQVTVSGPLKANPTRLVEQPESRLVTMPLRTMVTPLRDNARWPSKPVRLFSLPM